jgi:hypothetical protein
MKRVVIEPNLSIRYLVVAALCLIILHGISYVPVAIGLREQPIHTFNLDDEVNFAAIYSTFLLVSCSVLTWFIGRVQTETAARRKWIGLGWIFLFLGLDELMSFHERLAWVVHYWFGGLNLYGFAWLLPYGIVCVVLMLVYFKFWLELPAPTRNRTALGVALFIIGAIGCELIAWRIVRAEANPLFWHIEVLVEEMLEIAAGILLVRAFMKHITDHTPESCLVLRQPDAAEPAGSS